VVLAGRWFWLVGGSGWSVVLAGRWFWLVGAALRVGRWPTPV